MEEKFFPLIACIIACCANQLEDGEILKALYSASKDVFKRDDLKYVSNLVLNKEHLIVNGKILDEAEWLKHWQSVGFIEYHTVVFEFIKANLGNFTNLSALIPKEWTTEDGNVIRQKLLDLFLALSHQ